MRAVRRIQSTYPNVSCPILGLLYMKALTMRPVRLEVSYGIGDHVRYYAGESMFMKKGPPFTAK